MALFGATIRLLQASLSGVLAGALVWGILRLALRRWPALMPRRAVWLAAQGVLVSASLLALLPARSPLHVLPPLTVAAPRLELAPDAVSTAPVSAAAQPAGAGAGAGTPAWRDAPSGDTPTRWFDTLPYLSAGWCLVYAAGLALACLRLRRGRKNWRALLAAAQPLSAAELASHGAFNASQLDELARCGMAVLETDAAVSPLLIGLMRPCLLLPRHLREFSAEQQQMIIEHELNHWRRRDPLCLSLSLALQTVFWFNPALRWLGARLEWALELSCDQQVLAGRPQQQRKQYAAALLRQWQAQALAFPGAGMAFGGVDGATVTARVRLMQQTGLPPLSRAAIGVLATLMSAVLAAGALLAPAIAFNLHALPATSTVAPRAASAPAGPWRYPLDKMRVTSFFGVHRQVTATPHRGIDLAAPSGTPVYAVAAGSVVAAGELAEHDGAYGTAVIIDHGGYQTLYAHLQRTGLHPGDVVQPGQVIGKSGASGLATGPHLHLELRQGGRYIDPRTMLPALDTFATQRALRVRRDQLGA